MSPTKTRRDALAAMSEQLRSRVAKEQCDPLDANRRFTHRHEWPLCDCRAPLMPIVTSHGRWGYVETWFCPFCHVQQLIEASAQADEIAVRVEGAAGRRAKEQA